MIDTSQVEEPKVEEPEVVAPVAKPQAEEHTWTESIEIAGTQLVERVKALIAEGNVRRLILRTPHDEILLEVPFAAGVAVGGVMTVFAPVLVALGAMAALLELVKVEIIRVEKKDEA